MPKCNIRAPTTKDRVVSAQEGDLDLRIPETKARRCILVAPPVLKSVKRKKKIYAGGYKLEE